MSAFEIIGSAPLQGSIRVQGAKNEALQVLCACLLTKKAVTYHNVPNILDVNMLLELLEHLGVLVERKGNGTVVLTATDIDTQFFSSEDYKKKSGKLRGAVMLAGPMLARFKSAQIPQPGGDKIGRRRLDTHINGFIQLGAQFEYDETHQLFNLSCAQLKGVNMVMEEPSVTGTANVLMAAVMAEGTTHLYHAACEPYVQQLCRLLNTMGAKISGVGSNLLTIEGVSELHGAEHRMLADMIEVGSFIGLAATTGSDIVIEEADVAHLGNIPETFKRLGIQLNIQGNNIHVPSQESYTIKPFIDGSILTIYDHPWPGFTPDLLSIILVTATQANGTLLVHQKMFESRLFFVDKLIEMGAQIVLCDPHRAVVIGHNRQQKLRGISMVSPDIRAGVALLIAALSAQGRSVIHNIDQIDRGYEQIDERLRLLGAQIHRLA